MITVDPSRLTVAADPNREYALGSEVVVGAGCDVDVVDVVCVGVVSVDVEFWPLQASRATAAIVLNTGSRSRGMQAL